MIQIFCCPSVTANACVLNGIWIPSDSPFLAAKPASTTCSVSSVEMSAETKLHLSDVLEHEHIAKIAIINKKILLI
jgi:hypothetical protein